MREGALTKRWGQMANPQGTLSVGREFYVSTGGIAALAVKVVRWKNNDANHDSKKLTERRNDDGNHDQQDGAGSGGVAR